jgi:hypothetical protein
MSENISLMQALHELRNLRDADVRAAIAKMIDILATGQVTAEGMIDGARTKIDSRWWWAAAIKYPNSTATFRLIDSPGGSAAFRAAADTGDALNATRVVEATDVTLDRSAWDRLIESLRDAACSGADRGSHQTNAEAGVSDRNTSLAVPHAVSPPIVSGTGMPGRPSKGKHLIDDEFKRRCGSGRVIADLAEEASALLSWYEATHPNVQRPTVKTIKNNIRAAHRQYFAEHSRSAGAGTSPKI